MEEFLLRLLLAGDKLHVIHQQQVSLAVLILELSGGTRADCLNQFIGEIVTLDVDNVAVGVTLTDLVGDGIDQMGLAEAAVTVDKEGIVPLGGFFRDGLGCGMGKLVAAADNEGIKGEFAAFEQGRGLFLRDLAVILKLLVV